MQVTVRTSCTDSYAFKAKRKVSFMGNVIEVKSMTKSNTQATITKLDSESYIVHSTGEIKEFEHGENRKSNTIALSRTMKLIRELVNTNVTNPRNARFVTLTYAENMTDTKRLYEDFRKFIMRFNYYCKKNDIRKAEYVGVVEPQARGAWHMHVIFIWKKKAPFIPNSELAEVWRYGHTKITKIDNVDNIGLYLTFYLTSMPTDEMLLSEIQKRAKDIEEKEVIENGQKVKKSFVKGARLHLYPKGMNIVRHSKGIKRAKTVYMTEDEIQELTKDYEKTYERTVEVKDENSDFHCVINTRQWNRKRKKQQD